jgi:hypothetical protein
MRFVISVEKSDNISRCLLQAAIARARQSEVFGVAYIFRSGETGDDLLDHLAFGRTVIDDDYFVGTPRLRFEGRKGPRQRCGIPITRDDDRNARRVETASYRAHRYVEPVT